MTGCEGMAPHHLPRPLRGPPVWSASPGLARPRRGGATGPSPRDRSGWPLIAVQRPRVRAGGSISGEMARRPQRRGAMRAATGGW
jgi:hypothetical protein